MSNKTMKCWRIGTPEFGSFKATEAYYRTQQEAEDAITAYKAEYEKKHREAVEIVNKCVTEEGAKANGLSWFQWHEAQDYAKRTYYREYTAKECDHGESVYRLNTLPNESQMLMNELEDTVAFYGHCSLCWSCLGHTRAQWQTEAAVSQLKQMHKVTDGKEWKVEAYYSEVSISL